MPEKQHSTDIQSTVQPPMSKHSNKPGDRFDNFSDTVQSFSEIKLWELANSDKRLKIRLTNDFAFKKVFHNKVALSGLLSAALDIPIEQIRDLEFPDTYLSGENIADKEGILDVRVHMNNQKKINVEMQVKKFLGWEERALFYNCKMFTDNFQKGRPYSELEECIHISILGFELEETRELYSVIELRNRKTRRLYSDKFSLRVLYLNHIKQATEEEKQTEIYRWARLISAGDWEELKQMAAQNNSMREAYQEMEKINTDTAQRYLYLKKEMEESDWASIRETGYVEGREEGEFINIIKLVRKKMKKGIPAEECTEMLEENIDTIKAIYDAIESHPNWEDIEIYKEIKS